MRKPPPLNKPAACSRTAHILGRLWMTLFGWRVEGQLPPVGHAVVIAAPHTSNWDMPFMMGVAFTLRMRVSWLGKKEMFRGILGPFFRALGGIAVHRGGNTGMVEQVAESFADASEGLYLVVPASATRKSVDRWKSGFYHIAAMAQVPIVCSFLDYKRRVGGVGLVFVPSGDIKADMDRVRAFYADVTPKYPANTTRIRLKEEIED